MNIILTQLYIIATVCMLVCRTPILRKVKYTILKYRITSRQWPVNVTPDWRLVKLRPFDCPLCLTFWVSVIVQGYSLPILEAIGIASISALVASELEKYLRK
jgi:hypothetical protein